MQFLLAVFFILLQSILHKSVLAATLHLETIQDDPSEFNITCEGERCEYDYDGQFPSRGCDCGIRCVRLGTCCIDSPYAQVTEPKLKPACRGVHGKYGDYFIMDQCPFTDSIWASSCNHEWNGDEDVLDIAPVTSLMTSITYKNYYCFRCHETTDEFTYWNVMLESSSVSLSHESASELKNEDIALYYDNDNGTWMASYEKSENWNKPIYFPVVLSLEIPGGIYSLVHACEPNVISDCSEKWTDKEIKEKCHSYMGLREVKKKERILTYKNVHCALCNFESLDTIFCKSKTVPPSFDKVPFSFAFLLDINRSDGELVGKIQKCSDAQVWDPYRKMCLRLTCALPRHEVKNGKCVPWN